MELGVLRWRGEDAPREQELLAVLRAEGFEVYTWNDIGGTVYEPHSHPHDESIWMVSGAMTFGIAGREYKLAGGDRLMLPRDTVHAARAGAKGASYLVGQRQCRDSEGRSDG